MDAVNLAVKGTAYGKFLEKDVIAAAPMLDAEMSAINYIFT